MQKTRHEREQVAEKRLFNILRRHGIAVERTLEQKISDAGPGDQRIDPHILTDVRKQLVKDGQIIARQENGVNWFHLADEHEDVVSKRLSEQQPIYNRLRKEKMGQRIGQCLEIAIFRALCQQKDLIHFGRFRDLEDHDDRTLYRKEEPPQSINGLTMSGKLDFLVIHSDAGAAGIEAKNIRQWLYPDRDEIKALLAKAVAVDCVPVLIARRIPFVTFKVLGTCGVLFHQTYNQLLPATEHDLADKARDKLLLGYHDIRTGNQPDDRLLKFIGTDLPRILPRAREKLDTYKDLISDFANGHMKYNEFSARVRRRDSGTNEDYDDPANHPDYSDYLNYLTDDYI